jgi:hypothetical protein
MRHQIVQINNSLENGVVKNSMSPLRTPSLMTNLLSRCRPPEEGFRALCKKFCITFFVKHLDWRFKPFHLVFHETESGGTSKKEHAL